MTSPSPRPTRDPAAPVIIPTPGAHRGCSRHRGRRAVAQVWSQRPSGYGGKPVHVTTYACEDCCQRIEEKEDRRG